MRYFIDTEFSERPGKLQLYSIGLVCEDGREFYAISDCDKGDCNEWVREHVLPNLNAQKRYPQATALDGYALKEAVLAFVGEDEPEFWGYYADYDWVAFCWIFGAMVELPKGWPMYCRDLKQYADEHGIRLPFSNDLHNALEDARDIARNFKAVVNCIVAHGLEGPRLEAPL